MTVFWSWAAVPLMVLAACFAASAVMTRLVLAQLRRRQILDHPNDRSSHVRPTPRGGGWGVMLTLLPAWTVLAWAGGGLGAVWPVLAGATLLVAVSWADDLRDLPAGGRFAAQILAVAAGLAGLPAAGSVFQGWLPGWLDRAVSAIGWLWFINLFNFMDGIDGIAGSEAALIALGLLLVGSATGAPAADALPAAALAGAALGFLVWNWHPAKLFMGDVGSVALGYLLGFLLLGLAARGYWAAALLLPLYFLADATLTLLRRLLRGAKVWQAHREHFYQKAVQAGRRHDQVVAAVILADIALIALALASLTIGWPALLGGGAVTALLLARLAAPRRPAARRPA